MSAHAEREAEVTTDDGTIIWRIGDAVDSLDCIERRIPGHPDPKQREWHVVYGNDSVAVSIERIRAWGRLLPAPDWPELQHPVIVKSADGLTEWHPWAGSHTVEEIHRANPGSRIFRLAIVEEITPPPAPMVVELGGVKWTKLADRWSPEHGFCPLNDDDKGAWAASLRAALEAQAKGEG